MTDKTTNGLEEALTRQLRTTRERLGAMLGRQGEALSPWVLRRTLRELQNVADPAVSDVEGGRRAAGVAGAAMWLWATRRDDAALAYQK